MTLDELLDDLFHGCAVAAFITEARVVQGCPDQEKTRQRAYAMYEEELAARSCPCRQWQRVPSEVRPPQ